MQRNTFLAIALSAVVLFAYEVIFVAPKRAEMLKKSQVVVNKYLKSQEAVLPQPKGLIEDVSKNIQKNELISHYSSTDKHISYTNMGGSLHKLNFITEKKEFPLVGVFLVKGLENEIFSNIESGDRNVYAYQNSDWKFSNSYLMKNENVLNVRLEIKNISRMSKLENSQISVLGIDSSRMDNSNARETGLDEYSIATEKKILRKGSANKFSPKENKAEDVMVKWVGFREHYLAFVVKPEFETKGYEIKTDTENKLNVYLKGQERNLAPGESRVYEFNVYMGPQNIGLMKKEGKGFESIIAFSNFFLIEWISQAIYHIIPFFHSIIKSWGFSIILVSMLLYGLSYPLTLKSMVSMRKMQEVQPKILALREKYKNDPQKLNTEMVEIYRREKINPLSGCLPFLLQMPFFMALYQILWRAQYFQGQGFLWIKDLSQADKLFILPFSLPFLGNEFNILPILTGIIMFIQQKISSKSMVIADEQQAMQQKMMMYLMPVLMSVMFYKFASSWAIYFTTFYLFSTLTQWKISKMTSK